MAALPAQPGFLLKGGRVIDPASGTDTAADVLVSDGRITRVGPGIAAPAGARIVDVRDRLVVPGLVDLHAHLREPGEEYKEDIATGTAAAAAGGFTAVCAMPNTKPPNDCRAVTDLIVRRAAEVGRCRVYPVGAVSQGLLGEMLTEVGELKDAGAVALSDDGKPVWNARLMRRALEYGRTFGLPLIQHAEDPGLSDGGVMHEGAVSTRIGLRGQPAAAEEAMVARDVVLVELTGARYHVAHASTAGTVRLVREARRRGLPVSCEVTPHHLVLTDEACAGYDTRTKVNPPLRTGPDVDALREALADGTIEAIATDHAPHSPVEKDLEYDRAAFGLIGFETALSLVLGLVREGLLPLPAAIDRLTWGPARLLGLPGGRLAEGSAADVAVIDPDRTWKVDAERFASKSRNCPFDGWEVTGRATLTLVGGRAVHDLDGVLA